jgi:hypothetical protein
MLSRTASFHVDKEGFLPFPCMGIITFSGQSVTANSATGSGTTPGMYGTVCVVQHVHTFLSVCSDFVAIVCQEFHSF